MSDKTKERILNAIIAVGMVSIVTLCPGTFLLYFIFLKCSQFPSCLDFAGLNGIQNYVLCCSFCLI